MSEKKANSFLESIKKEKAESKKNKKMLVDTSSKECIRQQNTFLQSILADVSEEEAMAQSQAVKNQELKNNKNHGHSH